MPDTTYVPTFGDACSAIAKAHEILAAGGHPHRRAVVALKLALEVDLQRWHSSSVLTLGWEKSQSIELSRYALKAYNELLLAIDPDEPYPRPTPVSRSSSAPSGAADGPH